MKNKLKQLRHNFYYRISPSYRLAFKLQREYNELYKRLEKVSEQNKQIMKIISTQNRNLNSGERQVGSRLEDIRKDHTARYNFASKFLSKNIKILDVACGVGYGSFIMANSCKERSIDGVDVSREAINYANMNYKLNNIHFNCEDFLKMNLEKISYDAIVSFETIEHVKEDKELLKRFNDVLKEDGKLILSTPNELLMPFKPEIFLYHIKHYTPKQLESILNLCGFQIERVFSQKSNKSTDLIEGWNGIFNIVVCSKISNNNIA